MNESQPLICAKCNQRIPDGWLHLGPNGLKPYHLYCYYELFHKNNLKQLLNRSKTPKKVTLDDFL